MRYGTAPVEAWCSDTHLNLLFDNLKLSIDGGYCDIKEYKTPEKEMVIDATQELMDYLKTLEEKEDLLKSVEKSHLQYAEYYMKEYLGHKDARVDVTDKIESLKKKIKMKPLPKCDECGCECEDDFSDEEQDD